jgi:hypothetical protein
MPPFDENGNLPKGIYEVIWPDFEDRFAFNDHRQQLLMGLKQALLLLAKVGVGVSILEAVLLPIRSIPMILMVVLTTFALITVRLMKYSMITKLRNPNSGVY